MEAFIVCIAGVSDGFGYFGLSTGVEERFYPFSVMGIS